MRFLKIMVILISVTVLISCRHKTATSGEMKKIEPEDFLAMFQNLSLPVNFADSSLQENMLILLWPGLFIINSCPIL